uniref:Pre-mRNA-splicing factor 18 n=1 Tax=Strigamia maritima TaxID=126957 RepID=T1JC80_STRMM
MDILKAEIERKRKQVETDFNSEKKFFRRGELIEKYENIYRKKREEKIEEEVQDQLLKQSKEQSAGTSTEKTNSEIHVLPRKEVIKRLRDRGEPIYLYGETEFDAFNRLRKLEIMAPELNKGLRNDFQEALEKLDQAYLNEIFKSQNDDSETQSAHDVKVTNDPTTIDDIQQMAVRLGRGRRDDERDSKIILSFLKFLLQLWGQNLNSRSEDEKISVRGKISTATYGQTQSYLTPLFRKLKTKTIPEDILESLIAIVQFLLAREYVKANDAYLQMAIGNAPWPIGVTMVGIHARTGREKIFSKHVAHVLNDETQRKYIQALKRLMTRCQQFFPTDPSKSVEYNA